MPVLRHCLRQGGGPIDLLITWVSVPHLAVHAWRQRYTFVRRRPRTRIVRFESVDDPFVAEISFDGRGLVLELPRHRAARVVECRGCSAARSRAWL